MSEDIRQMIVVRKDLNMRKGKVAAQAAHASLGIFTRRFKPVDYCENQMCWSPADKYQAELTHDYVIELTAEMKAWLAGIFTKICVYVNNEQELLDLYQKAQDASLPTILITDNGLTEFAGVPTNTCIAIGPAKKADLDPLTGHLPLY